MSSPLLTIWFRPRSTLRHILGTNPSLYVMPLAMVMGITNALDRATDGRLPGSSSFIFLLVLALVIAPLGGIVSVQWMGALLKWSGGLLGGKAERNEVRAAIAWSSVIRSTAILLLIPQFFISGLELFQSETPLLDARMAADPQFALMSGIAMFGVLAIGLVLGIWYVVVFLKCLGEAHQFSAWKALLATIIGFGVIIVPVVLLVFLSLSLS